MIGIGYLIDGDEKMAAEAFESANDIRKLLSKDEPVTHDKAAN